MRSSAEIVSTSASTWSASVVRPSVMPGSEGVCTTWPSASSAGRTRSHAHPPAPDPWTRTNADIAQTGAAASRRYWCTKAIAMLPSPTAAATRLTGPNRTSPQAKMPGTLVSSR